MTSQNSEKQKTPFWPLFNTITQEEKGRRWPYLISGQIGDNNLGRPPWNCDNWKGYQCCWDGDVSTFATNWPYLCRLQAATWRMHATTSDCVPKGTPSRRQCQKATGISRLLQLPGNVYCYTIKTVISKVYCISCAIRQRLPSPCTVIIHHTKSMTHFSRVQFIARPPRTSGKLSMLGQAITSQICLKSLTVSQKLNNRQGSKNSVTQRQTQWTHIFSLACDEYGDYINSLKNCTTTMKIYSWASSD